jgi:chromosome segregation protein
MAAEEKGVERDAALAKAEALALEVQRVEEALAMAKAVTHAKGEDLERLQAAMERVQELMAEQNMAENAMAENAMALKQKVAELSGRLEERESQVEALRDALGDADGDARAEAAEKEVERLRGALAEANAALEGSEARVQALVDDLSTTQKASSEQVARAREACEQQVQALVAEIERLNDGLVTAKQDSEARVQVLQEQLARAQEASEEQAQMLESAASGISKERVRTLEQAMAELRGSEEAVRAELAQAMETLALKEEAEHILTDQVISARSSHHPSRPYPSSPRRPCFVPARRSKTTRALTRTPWHDCRRQKSATERLN